MFPRKTSLTPTDAYAFAGKRVEPSLFLPHADEVHISVAFTWDIERGHQLMAAWQQYYPTVKLGGPAIAGDYLDEFVPGLYINHGVTFTSRGCDRRCPWCLVPNYEGRLRPIRAFAPGWNIQDNNFLACPKPHRLRVYEMLKAQPRAAKFSGGLDTRLISSQIADELRGLRIQEVFLAADTKQSLSALARAVELLSFLSRHKLRCYVLIGFGGETLGEATERLEAVWELGCLPFAQLYQPADDYFVYPQRWRILARKWSRPAAMYAMHTGPQETNHEPRCDDL